MNSFPSPRKGNDSEIITELLDGGATIRQSIESGNEQQFIRSIKALQSYGFTPVFDSDDLTTAIKAGNLAIFKQIYNGFSSNERYQNWQWHFENAAKYHRYDIARFLLKKENADQNYLRQYNDDLIKVVLVNDDAEMIGVLIDGGMNFDDNNPDRDWLEKKAEAIMYNAPSDVSQGFIEAMNSNAVNVVSFLLKRTSGLRILERNKYLISLQSNLERGMPSRRIVVALFDGGVAYKDMVPYNTAQYVFSLSRISVTPTLLSRAIRDDKEDMIEYLITEKKVPLSKDLMEVWAAGRDTEMLERLFRLHREQDRNWTFADDTFWKTLHTIDLSGVSNEDAVSTGTKIRAEILENLVEQPKQVTEESKKKQFDRLKMFIDLAIPKANKAALETMLAAAISEKT